LSTEVSQELEVTDNVVDKDDKGKADDFKLTAGMQRPPPPAVFW